MNLDNETASADRIDPALRRIVAVVVVGTGMAVLDTTIVNIAVRSLTQELDADLDVVQWVITAYLLAITAVVPLTGWVVRRFTARRAYLVALSTFVLGSALCGLAQTAEQLVTFRVLQGIGGGAIVPIGQMIIVRAAKPSQLGRVMTAYGIPTVLAPVFGPTLGGLLLEGTSWHWIFLVNVFLGVPAVLYGFRRLPVGERAADPGGIDVAGVALSIGGLVALTYGLSEVGGEASSAGGDLGQAMTIMLTGAALVAAFVVRSSRIERPLLDMHLYRNRSFSAAAVATFCLGVALIGTAILLPLYYQSVRDQSAAAAGLLVAPRGIGATLGTWAGGRLMARLAPGRTAAIGVGVTLAFTIPFALLTDATPFVVTVVVLLLQGFGVGMSITPTATAAFGSLRPEQIDHASPQQQILNRIGGSIGMAALIVVLQHELAAAGDAPAAQADAYGVAFGWLSGITAVALVAAVVLAVVERRQRDYAEARPPLGRRTATGAAASSSSSSTT